LGARIQVYVAPVIKDAVDAEVQVFRALELEELAEEGLELGPG